MHHGHWAGGNARNTFVGYGLMTSLVILGWVLLGTMLLMKEIFGDDGAREAAGSPSVAPPESMAA
jgi:hypothetical protein